MNICPKCGAEAEGMFCPECGTKIEVNDTTNSMEAEPKIVQAPIPPQPQPTPVEAQPAMPFVKSDASGSSLVQTAEKKAKGFAIASLVLGIISILSLGALFVPEVLGIVFALVSRDGKAMTGLAKAGLICSIVGSCIFLLVLLI